MNVLNEWKKLGEIINEWKIREEKIKELNKWMTETWREN